MKTVFALLGMLAVFLVSAEEMTISILEFTTIDIQGQKFYEYKDRKLVQGNADSLNAEDRAVMDDRAMGLVKRIDAEENRETRRHERFRSDLENERNRKRRDELGDKILKSYRRTVIIGAEYMRAALGQYPQFKTMEDDSVRRALKAIREGRPSNDDMLQEFGKESGGRYVLTGTVADLQTRATAYKGYGIETKQTLYSLDVLFRMADTTTGKIVFSGVFTGNDRDLQTPDSVSVDSARFERMLKKACTAAAAELNRRFPAGNRKEKVK